MKSNLLLAFGSTLVCILIGIAVLPYLRPEASLPAGAEFESLDDLREQLAKRDKRDVRSDKSVSFRSIVQAHTSDYIIYELQPNLDVYFQRVPVRTNSYGMRSPEVSLEKGKDTLRIALLGDSYAFGWGVAQEKIFATRLQQELEAKQDVKKIEVLNFGVPGYSTFQQVTQFFEKGVQFDPDIVLVFFIDNDFGLPFFIKSLDDAETLTSSSRFQRMRKKVTEDAQRKSIDTFLGSIDPNIHLAALASEMATRNVPVYLSMNPRRNSAADERRLHVLQAHENLHYIPIKERYLEEMETRGWTREQVTLKGDPHPNALRHGLYGELLAENLLQAVTQRALQSTP